jgi:hypothetical protein
MSRHRPETPAEAAASADIEAAIRVADVELARRTAYFRLKMVEDRIATFPPVPGDADYVETFPDFDKS